MAEKDKAKSSGKVEHDREKYDRAGKEKDSKALKDIPSDKLRDFMKKDKDEWRAGKAKIELNDRQRSRDNYGKEKPKRDRTKGEKGRGEGRGKNR